MLCDHCHKNEACIFIQEQSPDGQNTIKLCQKCALKQILDNRNGELKQILGSIGKFLADINHPSRNRSLHDPSGASGEHRQCPHCGRSQSELEQDWELGCAECAIAFREPIDQEWRRNGIAWPAADSKPAHEQARPESRSQEIARLTLRLRQAVRREDYEQAAMLRDQLRVLKSETED
ncbi:MAG: UvrB/UvrC motif-containing protein [Lentisphaeria bacterium]|jgi:protein arginine kinase activator|nr:UvrB/UvrC motif-containing protein [Lentisphaeria bacterium]